MHNKINRLWLGTALAGSLFAGAAMAQDETIKVGVLHSLSGTMAISETTLKDVMLMLIEEQNAKGGVLGKQLEAVVVERLRLRVGQARPADPGAVVSAQHRFQRGDQPARAALPVVRAVGRPLQVHGQPIGHNDELGLPCHDVEPRPARRAAPGPMATAGSPRAW